jgi:Xaa-Pro aminopeptidase
MRYTSLPPELFVNNRLNFRSLLPPGSLALFYAAEKMPRNGDQYFAFRQDSDFFYLSGIEQENAVLLLFPDCPDPLLREVLFIEAYSSTKEIWEGRVLLADDAKKISGINRVTTHQQWEAILRECMNYAHQVFLNTNEYPKFYPLNDSAQLKFARKIKTQFPLHDFQRSAPLLESLRTVKSPIETDIIQQACHITGLGFNKVLETLKPGMFEFEIEAEITHAFTVNRADSHGYHPIIAGGKNACTLHYNDNNDKLNDGDLLLLDFGAEYANYSADLSRTVPVSGKFSDRQRACYEAVLRVFKAAIPLYVPGNTIAKINESVWMMMEKEMIDLGLFSAEDVRNQNPDAPIYKKFLMHGVAHHIGLDVHDVGSKFTPLAPGMVLTCEPGLYIREEKIGIRIENDILVTANGPVDLMKDIPVEADEIEALMNHSL